MPDVTAFSSAADMLAALRRRAISSRELLDLHLRRIERFDGALNSVVVRGFDRARRDAAAADERLARGDDLPLLGLPVTVKESIDVEGLPSTAGVPSRVGHHATADARTVLRLRDAGAVVIGKTNVCTWLTDYQGDNDVYGRTVNPWDPSRTSGGSTAGSAALAAGLVPLELGSDLGGSIRVPATFCGLVGHKPSEGLVPNSGHFPGSDLPNAAFCMAAQGPHARDAADVELALDVIAGPDVGHDVAWRHALPPPRHGRLRDYRVAVLPPLDWMPVDDEVRAALNGLADALRQLGASVTEAVPAGFGDLRDYYRCFRTMMATLTSSRMPAEVREPIVADKRRRDDEFHRADADGMCLSAGGYLLLHERREQYRQRYREFFRDVDVLLTPMTLGPAFGHTRVPTADRRLSVNGRPVEFEYMSFHPALATFAGHPATAFPAGLTRGGLPIGLQAIGPFLEDRTPIKFVSLLTAIHGGYSPPPSFAQDRCE